MRVLKISDRKISELKSRKKALRLTNEAISDESGVPLSTVQKIFSGSTKSPRVGTLEKIEDCIAAKETIIKEEKISVYRHGSTDRDEVMRIKETGAPYSVDKELNPYNKTIESFWRPFTLDDYYRLPDNIRAELIDGRLYCMTAPYLEHQDIQMRLAAELFNYIDNNKMNCRVWTAPVDVHLDKDDYTMVQPDILAICKKGENDDRLKDRRRIEGAPDFVVEILSPSSIGLDTGLKLNKYKGAGVSEYWIVDPGKQSVTVYDFAGGTETEYSFSDRIPVAMTGGDLVVDFAKIKEYLTFTV